MRIGYIVSALAGAFVLMYPYEGNISSVNSCFGIKQASASEESVDTCKVCGKAVDSMGKPVEVEEDGNSIRLCCEECANEYREHPDKYTSPEKKQEPYKDKYQRTEPQNREKYQRIERQTPQRGESRY
ncbi:MAG: hypothetical protein MRK01_10230 [Candidatus Scalindua sp.]|nr:hypothetical protein [Candidatus Scalindua sp.]